MKTQRQRVAEIWADWNERKLAANEAIYEVGKIFKVSAMREWRKRMEAFEK